VKENNLNQFKDDSKQKLKPLSEYYQYCKDQRILNNENHQKLEPLFGLEQNYPTLAQNEKRIEPKICSKLSFSDQSSENRESVLIQESLKDAYYQNSEDWEFKKLSEHYQKSNIICLSWRLGANYNFSTYEKLNDEHGLRYLGSYQQDKINKVLCNKFTCDRCRPKLKKRLKREIEKAIREHNLTTHVVITTEGKKYRDYNNYIQSYKDMAKNWHLIQKIIRYEAKIDGKPFTFICLYRAQKNGYCHLHILTNLHIDKHRLQEITSKYFSTGFIKITKNKDVAHYLANEFSKDHEFYIPMYQKHYSCSRDVKLNVDDLDESELPESEKFNCEFIHILPKPLPPEKMHFHLKPNICPITQISDVIIDTYGYPPPFEFLLAEFYGGLK